MRTFNLTINAQSWDIPIQYYERVMADIDHALTAGRGQVRFHDGISRWHTVVITNQHLICLTEPNTPQSADQVGTLGPVADLAGGPCRAGHTPGRGPYNPARDALSQSGHPTN